MKRFRGKHILHFFCMIGVFALVTAVVMFLWNALIPSIIGWSVISYWQALGLIILSRLLLGGLGKWGHWRCGHHHHDHFGEKCEKNPEFRQHMWHMHEKMSGMSPQDRRDYIRKRMMCNDEEEVTTDNKD